MKILPTTFKKCGFVYDLVERVGNAAIYRQMKPPEKWERFEVGRIRENKEREQFGVVIEAKESWPSAEEWGIRAWTYLDLTGAKKRLATLLPSKSGNP